MSDSAPFELIANRYQLLSRIGAGGFGEVWRGVDTVLNRPVAVKLLRSELTGQGEAIRRFQAEARLAGALAHAAVVRVYDYDQSPSSWPPYLVMEYVDGPSLAEHLAAGPAGPARTMDLVAQIASGLQAAHSMGLAHGDIKPHNVLLTGEGRVKLADFGVWLGHGTEDAAVPETLLGTPEYQAPERTTGGLASAASDLYSLGILAYQCLTGRVPFRGRAVEVAAAHRSRPLPPLPAGTLPQVAGLIAELTAKDPAERPGSAETIARRAAEIHAEITPVPRAALTGNAGSQPPPLTPPAVRSATETDTARPVPAACPERSRRRHLGLAAAAVIAAVVLAGALALVPHGRQSGANVPVAPLVTVDGSALRGQPVPVVAARLRALGLTVTIRWVPGSGLPAGRVVAVQPAGRLAPGTHVLVTGAGPAGAPAPASPGGSTRPGQPAAPVSPRPRPPRHGGPPTLSGSPVPSTPAQPTGQPSVTPTPTPTPTPSPTPTESGSGAPAPGGAPRGPATAPVPPLAVRPAAGSRLALCAAADTQWVTIATGRYPPSPAAGAPAGCPAVRPS